MTRGGEFNNKLLDQLHKLTGVRSSCTTPYHPQGDGQAERLNRTMINMLRGLSKEAKRDWKSHLPKLAFAYNSCINKSTGYSPFYLMMGRNSRFPIDEVFEDIEIGPEITRKTHKEFVTEWKRAMGEAVQLARKNVEKSADYNRQYYNKKAKAVEMVVGDHVLMRNVRERGGTGKMNSYWEEKIFKVIEKRENLPVYKIQGLKDGRDTRVVHRNLLMKVNQLPIDVFDEEEVPAKKKVVQPKRLNVTRPKADGSKQKNAHREEQRMEVVDEEPRDEQHHIQDSDEEIDGEILVYEEFLPDMDQTDQIPELEELNPREMGAVVGTGEPQELVGPEEAAEIPDQAMPALEIIRPEDQETAEPGNVDRPNDINEIVEPLEAENEDAREVEPSSEEDEEIPLRRSSRTRVAKRILSYDERGKQILDEV